MNTVKPILLTLLIAFQFVFCSAQAVIKIYPKDFNQIIGSWQGSLTYLDYNSKKPYTMPANKVVSRIGKTNQYILSNIYPDEPKANSSDTITISADGRFIDKEEVKSRRKLANGNIEITTEISGKDGNDSKPAVIRHIYILGRKIFVKRKEVKFEGQTEWIIRNEYRYSKKS